MSKPFTMKNPYPTKRMGKINPNSEGNTDTDCNTRLSAQHTLGRLYFAVITSPSPFNNIAK